MSADLELATKIKGFNLLALTPTLRRYIVEIEPMLAYANIKQFDYVKFFMGEPYFFTKKYICDNSIYKLHQEFTKTINTKYHFSVTRRNTS